MIALIPLMIVALSDLHIDQMLKIFESLIALTSEAVKAVWIALAPFLLAYLAYRQSQNRKALDANTQVSEKAFEVANGHNEKIVQLTETVKDVVTKNKDP